MVAFFIKYVQQHAAFLYVECALTDSVKCLGQRLFRHVSHAEDIFEYIFFKYGYQHKFFIKLQIK
jgi:hypothetical protein